MSHQVVQIPSHAIVFEFHESVSPPLDIVEKILVAARLTCNDWSVEMTWNGRLAAGMGMFNAMVHVLVSVGCVGPCCGRCCVVLCCVAVCSVVCVAL